MEENKDIQKQAQEIEDTFYYTTYLIGAMEKTALNDDGSGQRVEIEKELLLRGIYPINPVKLESHKTGMSTIELKDKMVGWRAGGCWELFKEKSKEIWKGKDYLTESEELIHIPGDIDYVTMSDWLTFSYHKGDVCCGSFGEAYDAMKQNIPIYLITDMPKKELPGSLLQWICISEGEIFDSIYQYLKFIDKTYQLHKKDEK